jgi:hypothetical protein
LQLELLGDQSRRGAKGQVLLTRVLELIDPETGSWDELLVREIFWEDIKRILATPMNAAHEDTIAWHFDRRGIFSVKSAYHMLDDEKERLQTNQRGECSSGCTCLNHVATPWKNI